jgi:hypothetical protein
MCRDSALCARNSALGLGPPPVKKGRSLCGLCVLLWQKILSLVAPKLLGEGGSPQLFLSLSVPSVISCKTSMAFSGRRPHVDSLDNGPMVFKQLTENNLCDPDSHKSLWLSEKFSFAVFSAR